MSIERALNRQDFARALERAYELEDARIIGSGRLIERPGRGQADLDTWSGSMRLHLFSAFSRWRRPMSGANRASHRNRIDAERTN